MYANDPARTVLLTGATGFVGLETMRRLVRDGYFVFALARGHGSGRNILRAYEGLGAVRFVAGDISLPGLGVDRATVELMRRNVRSVIHCAAHYDLDVPRDTAWQVNVSGTRHVLDLVRSWDLSAVHYVSSITVAGDRSGRVLEAPLHRAPRYRNWYEETKWEAERVVLQDSRHPVRLYRLGIVVGDSATGWTQKFDGPYAAFPLMRAFLPFAVPGNGENIFPLVNVDLAADVLAAGVGRAPAEREVLHVVDLDAPSLRAFSESMTERISGHRRVVAVPGVAFRALAALLPRSRCLALSPAAAEYMWATSLFDTSAFADFCQRSCIDPRRIQRSYDALALYYLLCKGRPFLGGSVASVAATGVYS